MLQNKATLNKLVHNSGLRQVNAHNQTYWKRLKNIKTAQAIEEPLSKMRTTQQI